MRFVNPVGEKKQVGVRADVFYSIADPEKVITRVKVDEIDDLLRETAIATLTNIIRSTALNEIAQSKLPSAISAEKEASERQNKQAINSPSAPLFFDKAHDEFLSKLHDDFLNKYFFEDFLKRVIPWGLRKIPME